MNCGEALAMYRPEKMIVGYKKPVVESVRPLAPGWGTDEDRIKTASD
jgi:hypothetical protein